MSTCGFFTGKCSVNGIGTGVAERLPLHKLSLFFNKEPTQPWATVLEEKHRPIVLFLSRAEISLVSLQYTISYM